MMDKVRNFLNILKDGKHLFEKLLAEIDLFDNDARKELLEKLIKNKKKAKAAIRDTIHKFAHEILVLALIALLGLIL